MLFNLFYVFAKIGAFTLGGGYAMVPLIQSEVVDKRKWIDKEEFVDILAVAQSTPGALAINMATFIGYRKKGILGSIFATLGCVCPSFFSILIIAMFFTRFMNYKIVERAFCGIRPAVAALIAFSVFKIAKSSSIKSFYYIFTAAAFILVAFVKLDPILIIIISAVLGILILKIRGEKDADN
ncbi:chromate transporter [Caloramator quimbayensis]|uniref:Chromate transporter n=1 Tax=Caloramator quimbayensis TaxID=1147123 RepID=A0A1T4WG36_9CLOT|nr:chromate transporter [Caloramator quimbayensis]SKA75865.1 chromate transporter [Caloramator quimbayensis]